MSRNLISFPDCAVLAFEIWELEKKMDPELVTTRPNLYKSKTTNRALVIGASRSESEIRAKHYLSVHDARCNFAIRWLLWRSAISISCVTDLSPDQILHGGRRGDLPVARRLCFWIVKSFEIASYNAIAKIAGYDHSTIIYGDRAICAELEDPSSKASSILRDLLCLEPMC